MLELGKGWADADLMGEKGLRRLQSYCAINIGKVAIMPQPREDVAQLVEATGVVLPTVLKSASTPKVSTKVKLRKSRQNPSK